METNDRPQEPVRNASDTGPLEGLSAIEEWEPQVWVASAGRRVAVEVDSSLFTTSSILRAAYKATDEHFVFVTGLAKPGRVLVVFTRKVPDQDVGPEVAGQFANELIDQRLREQLESQFGTIRTLVVAQAFAEGNLLDEDRDDGDYRSDPKGAGRRR